MNKKILIIEDELYIREMYTFALKQHGYDVIAAVNGPQGLEKVKDTPDLILLDIMMPKMNGLDVLKILKSQEETKHIPVVLITNLAEKTVIQQAFAEGAQGYVLKVRFDPAQLIDFIQNYLNHIRICEILRVDDRPNHVGILKVFIF